MTGSFLYGEPTLKQPTNVLFHESDRDSTIWQHKVVTKHVVVLYPLLRPTGGEAAGIQPLHDRKTMVNSR
jgi:hypothetical protein